MSECTCNSCRETAAETKRADDAERHLEAEREKSERQCKQIKMLTEDLSARDDNMSSLEDALSGAVAAEGATDEWDDGPTFVKVVAGVKQRADDAEAKLAALVDQLKRFEWSGEHQSLNICPSCRGNKYKDEEHSPYALRGHYKGCSLGMAIDGANTPVRKRDEQLKREWAEKGARARWTCSLCEGESYIREAMATLFPDDKPDADEGE